MVDGDDAGAAETAEVKGIGPAGGGVDVAQHGQEVLVKGALWGGRDEFGPRFVAAGQAGNHGIRG